MLWFVFSRILSERIFATLYALITSPTIFIRSYDFEVLNYTLEKKRIVLLHIITVKKVKYCAPLSYQSLLMVRNASQLIFLSSLTHRNKCSKCWLLLQCATIDNFTSSSCIILPHESFGFITSRDKKKVYRNWIWKQPYRHTNIWSPCDSNKTVPFLESRQKQHVQAIWAKIFATVQGAINYMKLSDKINSLW